MPTGSNGQSAYATLDSTINPSGNGTSSNESDSQQVGLPHTGDDSSKIAILGVASLLVTIPLIGLDLQSKSKDFQKPNSRFVNRT